MPNIEIKARYSNHEKAKEIATRLKARLLWEDTQIDTYFETRAGKLKLRESGLNGAELIPYLKSEHQGTKRSDYVKLPAQDAATTKSLLAQLLGTKVAVEKKRTVYLLDNVRIHLDEVRGLGPFLEFEAVFTSDTPETRDHERRKLLELMGAFEIRSEDLLDRSYVDLLSQRGPTEHFGAIYRDRAAEYEELISKEDYQCNIERTLRAIRPFDGLRVVEFGAGTGRLTRIVAPLAEQVLAFDASRAMLDVAEKELSKLRRRNWMLSVADNRSLPALNWCADLAIAGWTFGHLTEWHPQDWQTELWKCLGEMIRVLKPGGTAIILETLGTGREKPAAPTEALSEYYALLETRYGFERREIRTDYRFDSLEEADRILRFFFGDELADRAKAQGSPIVPECTGVWFKHVEG